ncbi:MAG TPA: YgjP-like metallopeptidase domain-containing protein [Candidatus Kapabacteria bacterium]|nr:YgjP-like metallopeptidase domain-containing protein [Candidatus Kapabacteria bacterium]
MHLLERRHNEKFQAYPDRFMPRWREYKAELWFAFLYRL